ncbi:MAG: RloB family protein [Aureispira sp.]
MKFRERNQGIGRRTRVTKKPEKLYILAYEGNETEPQYYQALKEQLRSSNTVIKILSLKRARLDTLSAPKHVFNQLKTYKKNYRTTAQDEFWMIIDRDRWKLDEWLEKCRLEKNFFVALTNPCFEFWLLLHLFEVTDFQEEQLLINKKLNKKKRFIDQYLNKHLAGGYQKNDIQPERFLPHLSKAIEQAKRFANNDLLTELGSDNYKLLEKLLA